MLIFVIFVGGTKLTETMLVLLANQFTSKDQLRTLGLTLNIDPNKIDIVLTTNNHHIKEATYHLLKQWKDNQENDIVAYKNICKALRAARLNFFNVLEALDRRTYLDKAYTEACSKENTKKVYNARMILAGYSEAGKTSLATKLLGSEINVDERKSTEGIALHRIESTFNNEKGQEKGGRWVEKSLNTSDLKSIFSYAVWSRAQEMATEGSFRKSSTGEKLKSIENEEHADTHNEVKQRKKVESLLSRSSSVPEVASTVQSISEITKKESRKSTVKIFFGS